MKNFTLIAGTLLITLTLTAFSYTNWKGLTVDHKSSCQSITKLEPTTFYYHLSPRAQNTITKEKMNNAKTIADLIPDFGMQENLDNNVISLGDVKIKIEEENMHRTQRESEKCFGNILSKSQINLLNSADYSDNFYIEGYAMENNQTKDVNKERYFNYYITVIPEEQASYKAGSEAFIDYLRTNCQATISKVQSGYLKSGAIGFSITKSGTLSDISLISTCGYNSIDEKMMELINRLPETWNVATDGEGEKVNQTLVFSYGQRGC